jgi:hypothetical protein
MNPAQQAPAKGPAAGPKRSLTPLVMMFLIFALPVAVAWFLYFNPEYLPKGRSNLGEIISPVVPLPADLALTTPEGAPLDRNVLAGRWTLVFLAGADCDEHCRAHLQDLRQIRLALGEGSLSTERLLILTGPSADALGSALAQDFDGMHVAVTGAAGGERLIGLLGQGNAALGRVYILDPMGNLMMRYAPDAPAKDTLKDMGRLIKASSNWIKGAGYGHK